MTADWNMQTNIKNKPNSQGTLFSGGTSQIDPAKRYPRGYTPERQKEISGNLNVRQFDSWDDDTGRRNTARTRWVHETVKRSTVPAEHLDGLAVNLVPKDHYALRTGQGKSSLDDAHGVYSHRQVWLRPDAAAHTLMHEIGHRASDVQETEHSRYNSPRKRGEEEGFADHYADEHLRFRTKDGATNPVGPERFDAADVRGRKPYYPRAHQATTAAGDYRPDHFRDGYDYKRPMESRTPSMTERQQDTYEQRVEGITARRKSTPSLPGMDMSNVVALKRKTNFDPRG